MGNAQAAAETSTSARRSPTSFGPASSRRRGAGVVHAPLSSAAANKLKRGDAHYQSHRYDDAARNYIEALELLRGKDTQVLVAVYLRIGHANRKRRRMTACLHCYNKALSLDPDHVPTLRALLGVHISWREPVVAEQTEAELFRAAETQNRLHDALIAAGDLWWLRGRDSRRAEMRYRRALSLGDDPSIRKRIRRLRS